MHATRSGPLQSLVQRGRGLLMLGAGLVVLTSCQDPSTTPMAPETDRLETVVANGITRGWNLPLMDAGQLARAFPGEPCSTSAHRAFDFWVGEWNVVDPQSGVQFGTNAVTRELDGCLVRESWTSAFGFRGLSLNTWDAETGEWHQAWASQVPQTWIGRLRTSGGLVDGVMVLEGQRPATSAQGTPFEIEDRWTWTPTEDGDVIQTGFAFAGEPFNQVLVNFAARYVRADISPAPGRTTPFCESGFPGAPTREADFLVGDWVVSGTRGPALGTSVVETDLSGCLFVERFETGKGLRAVAYTYFDPLNGDWFRIWVDNQGERLELRGGFEGDALVLEGVEPGPGGDLHVRVTWAPSADGLSQTWEVSRDDGTSWRDGAVLVYGRG